ncbi:MAG: CoA ester lyase [Acetobacteraceae bacterium]|nr:CoA ester lyase [Acetobacteraceae bacterium]
MSVYRTFLFAPGNHARRVEKSFTIGADGVILDLEDAVAISEKPSTRALVTAALQMPRICKAYVRVNATSTEWGFADLLAIVQPGLDGIILPKVEDADQLKAADWAIAALERERGLKTGGIDLIPIVETAQGLTRLEAIARAGTRTRRIAFGAGDMTLDLNMTWTRDEAELASIRTQFVVMSRAAGLEPPLDTVWADLRDPDGFLRSVELARGLGFQGKMCIHPDQVPVANTAFAPTEAQVEEAKKFVAAFAEAEAKGLASIQVDGKFIDYPIVYAAQRLLDRAAAIAGSAA